MATLNFEIGPEDEVDSVKTSSNNNNNKNHNINKKVAQTQQQQIQQQHNSKSCKDHLTLFGFSKKTGMEIKPSKNETTTTCPLTSVSFGTPPHHNKFIKSSSISRLLGATYNAKKCNKEEKATPPPGKFNTYSGRLRAGSLYLERFKRYAKDDNELNSPEVLSDNISNKNACVLLDSEILFLEHFQESHVEDLKSRAFRTISRGLGKLLWKRTHSVNISRPDPEFKVLYLGNVLTGWAKGEGCMEKQLNTLWRNYTQNNKPDVIMRIKVSASGLKATTRQHGLTEYWANRITHCCAPKSYPRVFCWIYRHEGRKLKHELRCHAVLCSKEKQVQEICDTLKANIDCALREFKREKILKQNARLSLANAVYDNPSLPRRKILLSVGSNNYRPPLERSKSAPKLMAIEEAIGEEGEEIEETNEPEMKSCCQKDSLYPAMTLGRRRCRKGHSIRRTGRVGPITCGSSEIHCWGGVKQHSLNKTKDVNDTEVFKTSSETNCGSDDSDDFEKILKDNDYDPKASLTNELLPYFERQLNKKSNSWLSLRDTEYKDVQHQEEEEEPLSILPCISNDPSADPLNDFHPNKLLENSKEGSEQIIALRCLEAYSNSDEYFLGEEENGVYFCQAAILTMLHRHSMLKMTNLSLSSDEGSSSLETNSSGVAERRYKHKEQWSISSLVPAVSNTATQSGSNKPINTDSAEEGSLSSGCETASTVTNNQDNLSLKYRQTLKQQIPNTEDGLEESKSFLNSSAFTNANIFECADECNNSYTATLNNSSLITLKMDSSPTNSLSNFILPDDSSKILLHNSTLSSSTNLQQKPRRLRRQRNLRHFSDSECSDESGYVDYQDGETISKNKQLEPPKPQVPVKPQIPPKPAQRRFINI